MYSARTLSPASLEQFYGEEVDSPRHRMGQVVNARSNVEALDRLVDLDSVESFLDIGAGYGYLLSELRARKRIDGVGVEPSQASVRHARNELGVDVHCCMLADAPLQPESFDLVASFEVIEHVPDPVEFVREAASFVRPGGHLVLLTDNFESDVVNTYGPSFPKWIPHVHINHFGPRTLREAVQRVDGLQAVKMASYTPWELAVRLPLVRARPRRAVEECFDLEESLAHENEGTYKLFRLRHAVNRFWFRLSWRPHGGGALMYLVCRKR